MGVGADDHAHGVRRTDTAARRRFEVTGNRTNPVGPLKIHPVVRYCWTNDLLRLYHCIEYQAIPEPNESIIPAKGTDTGLIARSLAGRLAIARGATDFATAAATRARSR